MEKIVTLLWKPDDVSAQQFADTLLGPVAEQLNKQTIRGLKICVRDTDTAAGDALTMTVTDQPKAAMVSYWVDMAQARTPSEDILKQCSASLQAFLVLESTPIINTLHPPAIGQRTEGFSQVTCVKARDDLDYDEFLRIWHNEHMACAIETQATFQYIRNEIVRQLTGPAAAWTAIVEEGFPASAMSNPEAFYDAVGDQEKFNANMQRMMSTVSKFLDLEAVDVSAMSEYVFDPL